MDSPEKRNFHMESATRQNMGIGRSLLTSVVAWKPTSQTSLGLRFSSHSDGSFRISKIDRDSMFAQSTLHIGDQVLSINDIDCTGKGFRQASNFIRLVSGEVKITVRFDQGDARLKTASFVKFSQSTQIGVGFKNVNERLCVAFSTSRALNVGDLVHSINRVDCRSMSAIDAANVVKRTIRGVAIKVETAPTAQAVEPMPTLADVMAVEAFDTDDETLPCIQAAMALVDTSDNPPAVVAATSPNRGSALNYGRAEFISAMVWKETKHTSMGICFRSYSDGSLRIAAIDPNGLFAESPLCVGDHVVSINQIGCRGKRYRFAKKNLKALASGAITIVVHNKGGNSSVVESSISKPTLSSPLGIGFRKVNGRLCVSSVKSNGVGGGSLLCSGHKIVSINGVDSRFLTAKDAAEFLKRVPHVATFVAQVPENSGIVVAASQ
jgi:predicted metalloprotease with PDZ domain